MIKKKTYEALRVLKGLSDQEARGLIEMIKEGKKMAKADIAVKFKDVGISSKTNAYEIIRSLYKQEVIHMIEEGVYEAMDSSVLLKECSESFAKMQEEIENISITINWEEEAEQEKSSIIKQEHDVIHMRRRLKKNYNLIFIRRRREEEGDFWNHIKGEYDEEIIENKFVDCVIFENPEKEEIKGGVILLSEKIRPDNQRSFFGTLIFDSQLKDSFKKQYGKKN